MSLFLVSYCASYAACGAEATDINVMTFNVRVPIDPAPNDWSNRKPRVISIISSQHPDFIGVQEATPIIITDLHNELIKYAPIGRGRESDGGGEGTQIFYQTDRWRLDKKDYGTLQLSPTPNVPGSNGWGMQWPRIFTWAHMYEKKTGKSLYLFNTHFPLTPSERDLSVRLLAQHIADRKHKNDAVILTGDMNACEDEASMTYLLGQDSASIIAMKDTYRTVHPTTKIGTFHAFGKTDFCKIDYIYTLGLLDVLDADIIKDPEGAGFASDHYAVTAKLVFDKKPK